MIVGVRKQNRRRVESRSWSPPALNWRAVGTTLMFFALATAVGYGLIFALDQQIRIVSVEGPFQRVSPVQVEQAVTTDLNAGFMTVDLEAVRARVQALAWVDDARVRRRWPNGLRIEVTEQVPAARWGESGLLNTRGELFIRDARHVPPELPRLLGPEGTEWQVAQRYLSAQGRLIEAGTRLTALELDARGAWRLELANGVEVRLGRREVEDRLDRFIHTALPVMSPRAREVSYVDMRYSNGFAIGWKKVAGAKPGELASRDAPARIEPRAPRPRPTRATA